MEAWKHKRAHWSVSQSSSHTHRCHLTALSATKKKNQAHGEGGGRGDQHERSSPEVAGPQVIPLPHLPADLEALQLSVSTSGVHLLGGLDEHRRRDFNRSVVSALFPVMEFLVQMSRLLFNRVVSFKKKKHQEKELRFCRWGVYSLLLGCLFFFRFVLLWVFFAAKLDSVRRRRRPILGGCAL